MFIFIFCLALLCSALIPVSVLQTYIPSLYWSTKEVQKTLLHDSFALDRLNWDDVESSFRSDAVLPVLNPHHPLSLTADLWWGKDRETYICLTGHYLDAHWIFHRILLDVYLCSDRHLGENICDWIKQVLQDNLINV
jgi:hypothetical protein